MPTTNLLAFLVASLALLLLPGPGVMYVVARSVGHGRRAGFISALGLSAGALVHVAAATAGLSALLLASATAFGIVKAVGAGYLLYLGLSTLFGRRPSPGADSGPAVSRRRLFTDGVLVSIFNPKLAMFFLAFLPQFADPQRGPVPRQILLLGLLYAALSVVTDGSYALLAGGLRHRVSAPFASRPLSRYLSGGLYLVLGLTAALTSRRE
jgi:threonine/homoserine/homoserine lactone efflux protein